MAIRGADRPPFYAALQLTFWAIAFAPYLRGRLLLAGTPIRTLSAGDVLDVTHALVVDGVGMVNVTEVLDKFSAQLARSPWPTRESWGTDPEAQAGQRAMMAVVGGPAPARDPNAPIPEAVLRRRRAAEETAADDPPEDRSNV